MRARHRPAPPPPTSASCRMPEAVGVFSSVSSLQRPCLAGSDLMTVRDATIGKSACSDRQEFPFITGWFQGKLQYTVRGVVFHFAVGLAPAQRRQLCTARAGYELPHAARIDAPALAVLRRKALVVMVMRHQHQVRA